ncbi:hypothetical protein MH117_25255 [Paenibacillus sp. ACRRX]|uniref:hypothetical protein n=1 Tax=unclassified Paenibacillus TaxID=185978 RepID=UPI001EF6381D|nr:MULTISPECIES: hypothetical protein [unclassified Paenibacillus]MCG7410707.1 hypothetical protein [Paenibacillus sp. ACRRX]MDK8184030.1 hypothetical protein [Paenibacillus sp. UMB4589-SE434]
MKWTTSSAVAWSTAMMLLLASPAAAQSEHAAAAFAKSPEARVVFASGDDTDSSRKSESQGGVLALLPSSATSKASNLSAQLNKKDHTEKKQLNKEQEQLQSQIKELRQKKLISIAQKYGIVVENKTFEQIRHELRQIVGRNGKMFHEKHVDKHARPQQHMREQVKKKVVNSEHLNTEHTGSKLREQQQ